MRWRNEEIQHCPASSQNLKGLAMAGTANISSKVRNEVGSMEQGNVFRSYCKEHGPLWKPRSWALMYFPSKLSLNFPFLILVYKKDTTKN